MGKKIIKIVFMMDESYTDYFFYRTMSPQWNELVLFENEFINLLLKINEYLILFEVIDKNESTGK